MNVIIIGDKFQKRMKSKGCVGLIKVNNKTIIQQQYKIIKHSFPKCRIHYVYGFDGRKLCSFLNKNHGAYQDLNMIANHNYEKYNNAYSLYLANQYLTGDTIIMFGDNYLHQKSFQNFSDKSGSQIFINNKQKSKLGCVIMNNKIENIAYDLDNYLPEIYFFNKETTRALKELIINTQNHNNFIFELINKIIDMKQTIRPFFADYKTPTLNKV
jgi:choline kinase